MKKKLNKTELKIQKEIKKRNNAFQKATKAEKRVLIAKDVIAQIKAKRYIPYCGAFVKATFDPKVYKKTVSGTDICEYLHDPDVKDMQENWNLTDAETKEVIDFVEKPLREAFFDNTVQSCDVCALGGIFMSCTLFNNKTKLNALGPEGEAADLGNAIVYDKSISNGLMKFFSYNQLELIENAFENGKGYFRTNPYANNSEITDINGKRFRQYYTYGDRYPNSSDRLIAIMKNIIKNKGTFIPEKFSTPMGNN